MNWNYRDLLPADFSPSSKVWVYQSTRLLTLTESLQAEDLLKDFVDQWKSHGADVKGYASLFFGQFIILMADESATGVSGCSTDSSVRLIKHMEQLFQVSLFDRQILAFIIKNKVELLPFSQMNAAVNNNFIHADTPYFNNTVLTKKELEESWIIPVSDSWLAKRISFPKPVS